MLDHVNPQEPAREYINGCRTCQKESKDRTQEEDAAPEPTVPPVYTCMRTSQRRGSLGPGGPSLLRFDEYLPSTEVQDFGNKTSKKHSGWDWPPICISPDAHC